MRSSIKRFVHRGAIGATLIGGAAGLLAGCNILGPGLYLVSDDRTPAAYKLDPKRPAVVFIDDRNSVLPTRVLRERIAKAAEKVILGEKLLEVDLISSDSLQQVVMAERFSRPRSIAEVGRAVQAEQVIYATVDSFTLSPDNAQHAPTATMRVKVIDAVHDTRLFPPESAPGAGGGKDPSFTITIAEKVRATALPHSTAEIMKEQQELADELGQRLGSLFYKHSSRDPNSPLGK
jgi:hypothetical protein